MHLNSLRPASGSRQNKKRVGRGIGSQKGKTCGRGHKGQHARSGGYHKVGFEGGQMPLQRRIPKFGYTSRVSRFSAEVRLHELNKITGDTVDLASLRSSGIITASVKFVKIFLSGTLQNPLKIRGCRVSRGARAVIEKLGGQIE